MVQFYAKPSKPSCDYLKLDSGESLGGQNLRRRLEDKSFATLRNTSVARLRTLYIRSRRGLLSYEGLPLHVLKRFVAQRALPGVVGQKNTVKLLKTQLEMADEEATFDRFLDLPPELRQIIYTRYFQSLNHTNLFRYYEPAKCQSPMTLASRDTRRESLPLFYEPCVFPISTPWAAVHPSREFHSALSSDSTAFLTNTSTENFARIKFLDLNLQNLGVKLTLDLNNKNDTVRVEFGFFPLTIDRGRPAYQERRDRVLLESRSIAMGIAAREGPFKLRQTDVKQLHDMVRRIAYQL